VNSLERKVLELIGEDPDAPDVFTDDAEGMAPIRDSLNDAIQEITMVTGGYKRQYLIPLRQDMTFYRITLPEGTLGWVTDAWLVNQGRRLEQTDLIRLQSRTPDWMDTSGNPEQYLPIGQNVLGLYPTPGGDSDVLELTVVEIPDPYESEYDPVKLQRQYEYGAIHYAVAEFWASRGDAAEAQGHMLKYLGVLKMRDQWTALRERRQFRTEKPA